jgi:hypothetical protein
MDPASAGLVGDRSRGAVADAFSWPQIRLAAMGGNADRRGVKLRLFGETIRFRVRKPDIVALMAEGFVERSVRVGPAEGDVIAYRLELVEEATWDLRSLVRGLAVAIPNAVANRWAESDAVGISFTSEWGSRVVIEKDFPCLEPRPGETDEGSFARPKGEPVQCAANE